MLNPKLIEKYGEKTRVFFDEFINRIGLDLADICYDLGLVTLESGDICAPEWIGVLTMDSSIVTKIFNESKHISFELRDSTDEEDRVVMCVKCTESEVKEKGIKIWVG